MSAHYIPKAAWTRKQAARHFRIAKARKADRAAKAWLRKGKSASTPSTPRC